MFKIPTLYKNTHKRSTNIQTYVPLYYDLFIRSIIFCMMLYYDKKYIY